jgi:L-iditol 2-dehydrogenase
MSSTVTEAVTKPNIGVYTNPEHKLWVAETKPAQKEAAEGANLKEGEVTLAIKSTGICG